MTRQVFFGHGLSNNMDIIAKLFWEETTTHAEEDVHVNIENMEASEDSVELVDGDIWTMYGLHSKLPIHHTCYKTLVQNGESVSYKNNFLEC